MDPLVFVVDDDGDVTTQIEQLLETVGLKTRAYHSATEFLDSYNPDQPGCLILDVRMPGMSGLELQAKLVTDSIPLPIIFLTGYGDVPMVVEAMKMGAVGFIEKPFRNQVLVDAIHEALATEGTVRQQQAQRNRVEEKLAKLSKRERQVMAVLLTGKTTKAVAAKLGISRKTVDYHRARIIHKMRVDSLLEIAQLVLPTAPRTDPRQIKT